MQQYQCGSIPLERSAMYVHMYVAILIYCNQNNLSCFVAIVANWCCLRLYAMYFMHTASITQRYLQVYFNCA